jgi:hypothetical protein
MKSSFLNLVKVLTFGLTFICSSMAVAENIPAANRALVILTDLDSGGLPEFRVLYSALEEIGIGLPTLPALRNNYAKIRVLRDNRATIANFRDTMRALGIDPSVKAIDAIVMLHGRPNRLRFFNETLNMAQMVERYKQADNQREVVERIITSKKARFVYNTSCFGRSHNQAFLDMGFEVSLGSVGVNANSEVEFPSLLTLWNTGSTVAQALAPTNNMVALAAADQPILAFAFATNTEALKATNSQKVIAGRSGIRINSDPNP